MTEELPNPDDREMVQLMAAQKTLMDNKQHHEEYVENIKEMAKRYGVEVNVDGA